MWFSPIEVAKLILTSIVAVAVALARAYPADIDDDRLICRENNKVELGPQIFDCIEKGKTICDQIPLFPESKQRCRSCCKDALQKQKTVVIFKDRKAVKPSNTLRPFTSSETSYRKQRSTTGEKVSKSWQIACIVLMVFLIIVSAISSYFAVAFRAAKRKNRQLESNKEVLLNCQNELVEKNAEIERIQQRKKVPIQEVANDNEEEGEGLLNGRHGRYVVPA